MCRRDKPLDKCQLFETEQRQIALSRVRQSHQLSKLDCQTIALAGAVIKVSTEATRLAVLLDGTLTYAPDVRHLSGKSSTTSDI